MLTEERIQEVFSNLRKVTQEYWKVKIKLMEATRLYEQMLGTGIVRTIIQGKNEIERFGAMYIEHPAVTTAWMELKGMEAEAKMELELAKLEVDQIDMTLRFLYGEGS